MLDPHTAAELTIDQIYALVDALLEAHADWIPDLTSEPHQPPRVLSQPSLSRCAMYTGMIEKTITTVATTFTSGRLFGRNMLLKIHSGSVSNPLPAVNVVTTISSNESANASNPPASSAERINGNVMQPERLEDVGAEVGRRFLEVRREAA